MRWQGRLLSRPSREIPGGFPSLIAPVAFGLGTLAIIYFASLPKAPERTLSFE